MNIFDRRNELMPRGQLEQLQLERLQSLLIRLKRNVRRYREKLGDFQLESLADLPKLPFTTLDDMAESFPYGMFAFPLREVIRLHTGVGPDGRPLVIGHTRNDLAQWGRLVARQLVSCGVTANDVIQVALGTGIYPSASGYVLGAELIEASVIAEDPNHIDYQIAMLQNYRPTILVTTPSNAKKLISFMESRKIDPQSLHLRVILLSRPVDQSTREHISSGLFAAAQGNYGPAEVIDPGFSVGCEAGHFHVNEDHFLVECIDGELVVTTLCREAMPLLRFRTRMWCKLSEERCACGRTGRIVIPGRRLDNRLCVNEIPIYRAQIEQILSQGGVSGNPFHVKVLEQHAVITIKMTESLFTDTIWGLERLRRHIESEFFSRHGIEAEVHFAEPSRMPKD